MGIKIGPVTTRNSIFLAPMSGVSDLPFRKLAHRLGAGLVVSEMVASEDLSSQREETLLRAAGRDDVSPLVIQLAGREARWMAEGAKVAEAAGADIVDINMGCPAKQVTRGLSGSALMRDPDHALTLIEATVEAVSVPVTLKMRLGWDQASINAPELARRAEAAGVQMITVHGRTRCQFYNGEADWAAIYAVKEQVSVPLVANGDVLTLADANELSDLSSCDAVMIGRGAYGRPWLPGMIAKLRGEDGCPAPGFPDRRHIIREHYEDLLLHYGLHMGVRCARKHLGWYLDSLSGDGFIAPEEASGWRARLCREDDYRTVLGLIDELFVSERCLDAA